MSTWQILGLSPTSDTKVIKKAYIKLIKQYHPEDHPDRFQQIRTAYEAALRWAAKQTAKNTLSGVETGQVLSTQDRQGALESLTGDEKPPQDPANRLFRHSQTPPPITGTLADLELPDGDLLGPVVSDVEISLDVPVEGVTETGLLSIWPDWIDQCLTTGRQQAAVNIFLQLIPKLNTLAERQFLEGKLYSLLAGHPVLPMVFTEHVASYFGWNIGTDSALGSSQKTPDNVYETYTTLQDIKRAVDRERAGKLKTLTRNPIALLITLEAFGEDRRNYIQRWVDVLAPYEGYFTYLGINPASISAWRLELGRPQFPNDENDTLFALSTSLPYAYFATKAFDQPLWAAILTGLFLWFVFCMAFMCLPCLRWAGYKWREDWRSRSSGIMAKAAWDIIPIGIMMFFCITGLYVFDGMLNAAIYGFFIFCIFLIGGIYFLWLAALSLVVIHTCSGDHAKLSAILILFSIFAFWLKIKLTISDLWSLNEKASRRIALAIIAACSWAAIYYEWRLPV